MEYNIDSRDWKILYELCKDARISRIQLAKKLRMSKNTVLSRIKKLEQAGIIDGYTIIMNQWRLGYDFYTILFRLNLKKRDEKDVFSKLKNNKNILVIDKLSGEWNLLIQIRVKNIIEYYIVFDSILNILSSYINTYQVHIEGKMLKFPDLLPVPIAEQFNLKPKEKTEIFERIKPNPLDIKILYHLAKDASVPFYQIANKLNITVETLSKHIKHLKKIGILKRFTAVIDTLKLGYTYYLVLLELKDITKRDDLIKFVGKKNNVSFSVFSDSQPLVFIYFVTKRWQELDEFVQQIEERFTGIRPKYLVSSQRVLYDLFPDDS